ncbi:mediator of RNA polymerase II transcription subunit 8 [Xylographa bjoerkii]|nr:mediator of RNA polymerase II transcription subunit 8 [Xylographa bjoerkii]
MSTAALNQQEIKALEQTRQRLSQLSHSLGSLYQQVLHSDPLPPWYTPVARAKRYTEADYVHDRASLQSVAAIISQNLATVSQHLSTHQDLFASMVVYPLPDFPGQTQEALLGQLLRKKLEPNVEDWVAEGRHTAGENRLQGVNGTLQQSELQDLWSWAGMAANEEARKHTWGEDFTLEEREMGVENVVTGLRRKLKEDPDESSDDDEDEEAVEFEADADEMEIVGVHRKESGDGLEFDLQPESEDTPVDFNVNAMPINDTFRFLMTGTIPSGR